MSGAVALGQGMGRAPVVPDWPPLVDAEVTAVLRAWGWERSVVTWTSPRPFSAAALVEVDGGRVVFVKRHHHLVRTPDQLQVEHAFADHLRAGGVPVPEVLRTPAGESTSSSGPWTWEVAAVAAGADSYRHALSWTPYRSRPDALAAGATLADLHTAAGGFEGAARPAGVLVGSSALACSPDPLAAVGDLVAARPGLARWLGGRGWRAQLAPLLRPFAPVVPGTLWGHGDWHPSNLTWAGGGVAGVLDLGLGNRTGAPFDVAVALERAGVGWLDLAEDRPPAVDRVGIEALLAGYASRRPLDPAAVAAALPLAHVDLALSEVEYFASVTRSAAHAALAWDSYLCGHLAWWASPPGRTLLADVARM